MRKIFTLALLFMGASAWAVPSTINFQGKLLNPSNNNPQNGSVTFVFRIWDAASGGNLLWGPETQAINVTNGVFSAQLGAVTALSTGPFSVPAAYLGVTVQGDAGGEMTPRSLLATAPYAFSAAHLVNGGDIGIFPGANSTASTFTAGGNLQMSAGISATTGTFTGTGNAVYSITTSSGISMTAGTLYLGAATQGIDIDAVGNTNYGVSTSSGINMGGGTLLVQGPSQFTQSGNNSYSILTSSGIDVQAGTLNVDGTIIVSTIEATGPIYLSSTVYGAGWGLTGVAPQINIATANASVTLTAGTEKIAISTNITVSDQEHQVFVIGAVTVTRAVNSVPIFNVKIRRNIGSACTIASTEIYGQIHTHVTTASDEVAVPIFALDEPMAALGTAVWYCLDVQDANADNISNAELILTVGHH